MLDSLQLELPMLRIAAVEQLATIRGRNLCKNLQYLEIDNFLTNSWEAENQTGIDCANVRDERCNNLPHGLTTFSLVILWLYIHDSILVGFHYLWCGGGRGANQGNFLLFSVMSFLFICFRDRSHTARWSRKYRVLLWTKREKKRGRRNWENAIFFVVVWNDSFAVFHFSLPK